MELKVESYGYLQHHGTPIKLQRDRPYLTHYEALIQMKAVLTKGKKQSS
jgi:hypothetical protein